VIREDRIRKIHAERFPNGLDKIARFRNIVTKTAKSRQTDGSPVAKLGAVENKMEALSNGQDD
jgi:hypothetical protein